MVLSIVFLVIRGFFKDSAVMKIISIAIHGLVVVFLIAALGSFDNKCTSKFPKDFLGEDVHYAPGPGSALVIVALLFNIGIAIVHVLAPATGSDAHNRQHVHAVAYPASAYPVATVAPAIPHHKL
jgi:multisubunit Na+/H+ antiporter MnhC subunit